MVCGPARIRIDVFGGEPREHVLEDMNFMNYRLADVEIAGSVSLPQADIVWQAEGEKSVAYDGRLDRHLHRAVGGRPDPEDDRGHACAAPGSARAGTRSTRRPCATRARRSCSWAASRTTASRWASSRPIAAARCSCRPRRRSSTTAAWPRWAARTSISRSAPRARSGRTRPRQTWAWPSSSARCPPGTCIAGPSNVDVVIVPAIDGNFDPSVNEMIPFERQFQTLHSLQNYFLLNELLAPGCRCRCSTARRCATREPQFVERFSERPYFFIRAANPQVLMDEVEKVI